jgi:FtsH-binding integral membrane protein
MSGTSTAKPNQGLLIAAWICAFLIAIVGLILSIIGLSAKKDRRFMAPLIVSIIVMILGIILQFTVLN